MKAKSILVIDDEELITKSLALALEKCGWEVLVAKNGDEAVAMAEELHFDLIISDIRMPGFDGIEAIKRISKWTAERKTQKVPIIFITGYADPKAEAEAKRLKPKAYILKPFDLAEFISEVKKALGQ